MTVAGKQLRAWVAFLAFAGSFGLPFFSASHLSGLDDEACGQVVLATHSKTQFQGVTPIPPPQHCAYCHWQRAVGGATTAAAGGIVPWIRPQEDRTPAAAHLFDAVVILHRPSRAPPAGLHR
jgi:hypothetical protein